jgi:putative transposase
MSCYQFVADQAAQHAVRLLCRMLGVSRSGYYAWRHRQPSARARADEAQTERIRQIHERSRATYGSPRVQAELRAAGQRCGRHRVARLMRRAGLRGVHGQRPRVRTTVPDRAATPAPDRVRRAFAPDAIGAPDRLWLADISYVATLEGWLYLAVILDGFSRKVVGWAMAEHLRSSLVSEALTMALQTRRPGAGLIHHSDHGGQYTSLAFGEQLRMAGLLASMGSVGDAYDNAVAEAFFSSLKVELIDRQSWPTRAAARLAIFEYIEVWYNRKRRHSTLGYLPPTEYELRAREAVAPNLVRSA